MPSAVEPVKAIQEAARRGKLVVVSGTGVSLALTNGKIPTLSWRGLVADGLRYAALKGQMTPEQLKRWEPILASDDLDELLSAAELMGRRLEAPSGGLYARWLEKTFKGLSPDNVQLVSALGVVRNSGARLATLNYDTLLEEAVSIPSIRLDEKAKVGEWIRTDLSAVLHLHGIWNVPESCVLGIRDYQATLSEEFRNLLQRSLSAFDQMLFIGCGQTFEDPNLAALVMWLRENVRHAGLQHYALVRDDELDERHKDQSWSGFVEPVSYGAHHSDLASFLKQTFDVSVRSAGIASPAPPSVPALSEERINAYREFLVRDSGLMSIEGVNADFETAQQRFEIEELFVPLQVHPLRPDIPLNDPDRQRKLREWEERNKSMQSFGEVFATTKRLALLALQGGGKTMLLKRLAVAYADPSRRLASGDQLPDIDIIPVLIRCREWRAFIAQPITVLLENLPKITGRKSLEGIHESILALASTGRLALLVDGLDEIHNDADRAAFVANLESFLDEYPDTRLIVTSREAGFSLVAPAISRFCDRWGVSPLAEEAIRLLCRHWHELMVGVTRESSAEATTVADRIISYPAVRRLAENPLLLTMLLVVKHGAGRLPTDRVGLYDRAVEVLLDTWNIKGHAPLNVKESVPQLACVAYELMKQGKQTATKDELLGIIEAARDKITRIRLYAKGTPDDFLRRVELRSSLLVEAGHQLIGAKTVPFYQFRHLTFQEYLASVATSQGYYLDYLQEDTVLTPLQNVLVAEEWKEVVPMTAALARKQAEPLILALVQKAQELWEQLQSGVSIERFVGTSASDRIPPVISRIVQCLVEEAEASPTTLSEAQRLIVLFANGCNSSDDWDSLSIGPYGEEIISKGLIIYIEGKYRWNRWIANSIASLAGARINHLYSTQSKAIEKIIELLSSQEKASICRGLLTLLGWLFLDVGQLQQRECSKTLELVERHMFLDSYIFDHLAAWTMALIIHRGNAKDYRPNPEVLDRILVRWIEIEEQDAHESYAFALEMASYAEPLNWRPVLSTDQVNFVRQTLTLAKSDIENEEREHRAAIFVAHHNKTIVPHGELLEMVKQLGHADPDLEDRQHLLRQAVEAEIG